ncbi:MAG: VOC family protein [Thermodesulfobacteriota bacterium]
MGNPVCWVELTTSNLEEAKQFYTGLFKWQLEPFAGSKLPYFFVHTGQPPTGGMMPRPGPDVPVAWTMYVEVDDLSETCEKLKRLGGTVLKPKASVPGMGWYAVVSDPQGAVFGLWQQRKE